VKVRRAQPWLGTLVDIQVEGDDAMRLRSACDDAFGRIAEIHAALSFQSPDSELTHVNRMAQTDWVGLSPDFTAVLAAALDFARLGDGNFDPCVGGRLVAAGRLPRHAGFPEKTNGNWRAIEFDGERLRFRAPLLLDFSGIAKGHAVDQALATLRSTGVAAATVNAGGDLAHFGHTPIPFELRDPTHPTRLLRLAQITCGAAATSADYFQPGQLIDPADGTLLCRASSITVLAADCLTADALTKIVAADPKHAPARLAHHGAQAILFDAEGLHLGDAKGWRTVYAAVRSATPIAGHGQRPQPVTALN
jgi:thiamine biosynthesis lipoprotein